MALRNLVQQNQSNEDVANEPISNSGIVNHSADSSGVSVTGRSSSSDISEEVPSVRATVAFESQVAYYERLD